MAFERLFFVLCMLFALIGYAENSSRRSSYIAWGTGGANDPREDACYKFTESGAQAIDREDCRNTEGQETHFAWGPNPFKKGTNDTCYEVTPHGALIQSADERYCATGWK